MRVAVLRWLALLCLCVPLAFSYRPHRAHAGGLGISEAPCGVGGDTLVPTVPYPVDLVDFHRYKVPFERAPKGSRDYEFMWSDTYRSRFHMPLDSLSGAPARNDMDRIAETACDLVSNPFGLDMSDVELAYNYLAMRLGYRDSLYNNNPLAAVGFRVAQPSYPDPERTHVDAYIYARQFYGYGQWPEGYPGDAGTTQYPIKNYGLFPSDYVSSEEDGPAYGSAPLRNNSIQMTGPFPSQVAGTGENRWTRPGGTANAQLVHESTHAWNNEPTGGTLHMLASGAEVLTGVSTDPPRNDVDYHFGLSPTNANEGNAYPHWQSFMAYLAFNWRGTDWTRDLVRRWATKVDGERTLSGLAMRLRDSECPECVGYPGFAGLDSLARIQRLIHDWRVANYVNAPSLAGGKYGFPPQYGFSPVAQLGAWQSIDSEPANDAYAIPPVATLDLEDVHSLRWFTEHPGVPGTVEPRPLELDMFGAEYFVFRAGASLGSDPRKLLVRVGTDVVLAEVRNYLNNQVTNPPTCEPRPSTWSDGRLTVSVVTYSQAVDDLFRHPELATQVFTQSAVLDSVTGDIEFELSGFGSAVRAVLVVATLGDGRRGFYQSGNAYRELSRPLALRIGAGIVDIGAMALPVAVAVGAEAQGAPAWSPDGTSIAYRVRDAAGVSRIWRRSASGVGPASALCTATSGQHDPSWSPLGDAVVYADGTTSRRARRVDIANGASTQITSLPGIAHEPVHSPNGAFVAYFREWVESVPDTLPRDTVLSPPWTPPTPIDQWDVRRLDLSSGVDSLLTRFTGPGGLWALRWTPNGRALTFSRRDSTDALFLHGLDVNTRTLTTHNGQAPDARMREARPGFGPLLVEEQSGWFYPRPCTSPAAVDPRCNCQPDSALAPAHWIALRDTVAGVSTPLAYRKSASFSMPRWSPDGTKVAYVTTQNDGGEDVYVASTTFDRAPYFTYTQSYYSVPDCQPFTLFLEAHDPDGDFVTFEALDLPAGATLQSGNQISWPYPVLGQHRIIARALDALGALASKVIRLDVHAPGCGGGGGGGEEEPPILPGGGNSARHADASRLIGGSTGPPRVANTLLDGTEGGAWVAQTARLFTAQTDSAGNVTARLVGLRPGTFAVDRARLVVVDHAPQSLAVATADGIAVGMRRSAASAVLAGGEDLAASLRGTAGGSRLVSAGAAIAVAWQPGEAIDGLVLDCARASTPESGAEWGVRVEAEVEGAWRLAGRIHPRGGFDALAVALEPGAPVRLVFASDTYVRDIAGYSLVGAQGEPATMTSVALAETDGNAAALAEADSAAVELSQGQRVKLDFAGPAPVEGRHRTYFMDLVASFTPEASARPAMSTGAASLPARFALHRNQPNPFGGGTTIRFDVPRAASVRVEVFDAQGRRVRTLADGAFEPGRHAVVWDGADASGRPARPGVYLYRLMAEGFRDQRRMAMLGR